MISRTIIIMLLVIIIGLLIPISNSHAQEYRPFPDSGVEKFIELHRSIDIPEETRRYLYPEYVDTLLPEAIMVTILCYSNGSWKMYQSDGNKTLWDQLTFDGGYYLNDIVVSVAHATCESELENYYGPPALRNESRRTWYH